MCDYWLEEIEYIKSSVTNFLLYSFDVVCKGVNYFVETVETFMQELDNLIIDNSYDINKWNEMNLIIEKKKDWLELKEEYKNEDTIYDSLDINNNKSKEELLDDGYIPLNHINNHDERFYIKDLRQIEINYEEYNLYIDNLKLLSSVKEGDRISIDNDKINITDGYIKIFFRYWRSENRNTNFDFIYNFYYKIFKYVEKIKYNQKELKQLKQNLKNSMEGLKNLSLTYKEDDEINNKLESLISEIEEI